MGKRKEDSRPYLAALLHLLAAFAETSEVHLALAPSYSLLKLGYPHTRHIVCLRLYSHLCLWQQYTISEMPVQPWMVFEFGMYDMCGDHVQT